MKVIHRKSSLSNAESAVMEKRGLLILLLAGFCVPAYNQIRKHVFVETVMSWSEAQSYCRENYIDLATVSSQEEAEQLLNIAGASFSYSWIGLYRDNTQNWQWSNSDDVIYSNWRADIFCASVNSEGKWIDLPCHLQKDFMCYKGFCVPAYNQIRKHVFVETVMSWSEAQSYCRENYIDLATVSSQEEAEQLLNIAGASRETCNIAERYTLIEELKTWTEAQQYCREHHSDLVSIKNASENEDLKENPRAPLPLLSLKKENPRAPLPLLSLKKENPRAPLPLLSLKKENPRAPLPLLSLKKENPRAPLPLLSLKKENPRAPLPLLSLKKENPRAPLPLLSLKKENPRAPLPLLSLKKENPRAPLPLLSLKKENPRAPLPLLSLKKENPRAPLPLRSLKGCSVITSVDSEPLQESGFVINFPFSLFLFKVAESSRPPSTPVSQDKMAIARVKLNVPIGVNPEDPKVSEAILEQIREHLSKNFPMDGINLRWRKQDGEIFHKDEEEEEEEKCSKP
ncbi:UNVERIFIED_CONTAM: hypothetical protein FKN15_072262 [Acipenser sinensis]